MWRFATGPGFSTLASAKVSGEIRRGNLEQARYCDRVPCERAFEKRDFIRSEVEKLVDDGIDLAFGLFDFRRQAAHLFAFLA